MSMGIPIPMGLGWVWEYDFLLWRSTYGSPYGENHIPIPMGMGIHMEIPSHSNPDAIGISSDTLMDITADRINNTQISSLAKVGNLLLQDLILTAE